MATIMDNAGLVGKTLESKQCNIKIMLCAKKMCYGLSVLIIYDRRFRPTQEGQENFSKWQGRKYLKKNRDQHYIDMLKDGKRKHRESNILLQ